MTSRDRSRNPDNASESQFATTHWSVVLAAGGDDSAERRTALEWLCRAYWLPVYAYIRRKVSSCPDAEDLTQGFFQHLLTSPLLLKADPQAGKFRCLLVASLRHFLINETES